MIKKLSLLLLIFMVSTGATTVTTTVVNTHTSAVVANGEAYGTIVNPNSGSNTWIGTGDQKFYFFKSNDANANFTAGNVQHSHVWTQYLDHGTVAIFTLSGGTWTQVKNFGYNSSMVADGWTNDNSGSTYELVGDGTNPVYAIGVGIEDGSAYRVFENDPGDSTTIYQVDLNYNSGALETTFLDSNVSTVDSTADLNVVVNMSSGDPS